ncbi:MAG: hypothetical protein JW885_13390 [Deltaproteobacteria bacterium]|nr:hypothetical protein [Candidatus Zymogenaceae bacterium]
MDTPLYAAVDIGTNTTRLLIARDVGGSLEVVERRQHITRLGEGIGDASGRLRSSAIRRTVDALSSFREVWEGIGVGSYRAVATAAARESENGDEFIAAARDEAGVAVELITPMEEARLAVRGVRGAVPLDDGIGVLVDVGGGSTEFILTESGVVSEIVSTDLGVVRLRERFITTYPPFPHSLVDLENWLDNKVSLVYNQLHISRGSHSAVLDGTDVRLVGTAGTATSLAAMDMNSVHYDPLEVDGYVVSRDVVGGFITHISALNQEEILDRYPILMKGREDVILPGIMIIAAVMDRFNAASLIVSDRGLLEGIVEHLIHQS